MSSNMLSFAALIALCSSTAACMAPALEPEDVGQQGQAIVGGKVASAYPEAALVDLYQRNTLEGYCSGAVIAPQVVLTAGHCVYSYSSWRIKTPYASGQTAMGTSGVTYDWKTSAETVDPNMHDIGLIFLSTPITLPSYPTLASAVLATDAKLVNIGRIRDGVLSTTDLYVSPAISFTSGALAGYPLDYAAVEKIESGDSGGPDMAAGTHTIVAVNSGAGGGTEVLARVDLLEAWIRDQIDAHSDAGSGSSGRPSSCAHPLCSVGTKLTKTCDPCAHKVCSEDAYCCTHQWDAACVDQVARLCDTTCP